MGRSDFFEAVCSVYALAGRPRRFDQVGGGANLTWRLRAGSSAYLIKELPVESGDALHRAARFERDAFDAGIVPMAEPCTDREGELLRVLTGSRGEPVNVRVHRFVTGRQPSRPVAPESARKAGQSLARIHAFGEAWAAEGGSLPVKQLWRRPDRHLFDGLVGRWPGLIPDPDSSWATLEAAQLLVHQGLAEPAVTQPSHCDHKPENSLADGDRLIILDWDEAGACDPRIEALETAVRWAWTRSGAPDPDLVASFADGYREAGRSFPTVDECAWAKWIAGIASWYEFNAQRSRGDWPAVASSSEQDARSAAEALHGLQDTIDRHPGWTRAINAALMTLVRRAASEP